MKGVTAVAKQGLADVPFTVTHLNLSNISDLGDTGFASLFIKEGVVEASLGVSIAVRESNEHMCVFFLDWLFASRVI